MSHVKAGGTSKNNHNNAGQRLGVKLFGGEKVSVGQVIVRQVGMTKRGGEGTRDDWHDRSKGVEGATAKGVGKWMPEELMKLAERKSPKRE